MYFAVPYRSLNLRIVNFFFGLLARQLEEVSSR